MRVLLASSKYQPEYSGSGFRAHNTYKRLAQKFNIDYDVLASSLENTGIYQYQYEEIEVLRIGGILKVVGFKGLLRKVVVWLNMPFEIFRTWLFIRSRISNYDLLHTFGDSWSIGFLTWYFSVRNKPIMRELCNDIPTPFYPAPFKKWIKPIFQKDNVMIVAISPMLETLAKKQGTKNVWQRPNPINENKFNLKLRKEKYQLREKLTKFSKNDIVLSSIANFSDRKNQLFLLKVLNTLPTKYKLILVGGIHNDNEGGKANISSNDYIETIKQYIDKKKLDSRVQIKTKFINNPQEYMALSDVYCFPSKHEGLGTPILESQACGIPIVSNKLKGITDKWIKEGGKICVLDEDIWARKVQQAEKIAVEILGRNAIGLLEVASCEVIDQQYYFHFKKLINV
jgi:glycosyltransferase involved in cell wall biosynthesis